MNRRAESLSVFVVQRHFRQVRRGYDPDEVEQHLERVRTRFAESGMHQTAREIEGHLDERERSQPSSLPQLWIRVNVVPHLPGAANSLSASRRSGASSSLLTLS